MIGIPEQSGSEQCRERHVVMDERNAFEAINGEILRLIKGQAADDRLFPNGIYVFVKLEFMRHLARLHLITPHFCVVLDDLEVIRVAQRCQIVLGGDVTRRSLDDEFVCLARLTLERLLRNKNHLVAVGFLFDIRYGVVSAKHENAVDFGQNILVVAPLMHRRNGDSVLAHLGSHIAKHGDGAVQDLAIRLIETVDVDFIDSAASD